MTIELGIHKPDISTAPYALIAQYSHLYCHNCPLNLISPQVLVRHLALPIHEILSLILDLTYMSVKLVCREALNVVLDLAYNNLTGFDGYAQIDHD